MNRAVPAIAATFVGLLALLSGLNAMIRRSTTELAVTDRRGIPHHLIDIVDPNELFTAGEYARLGRGILPEIAGRRRVPVIAGGTGFYLRALLEGLSPGPPRDTELRSRLLDRERKRTGALHRILWMEAGCDGFIEIFRDRARFKQRHPIV